MAKVVGINFRDDSRIYNYIADENELKVGEGVILEGERGPVLAYVACPVREVDIEELGLELKSIRRKATEEDLKIEAENRQKEKEAFQICLQKVHQREMSMKLVNVEYLFDRSKIIFGEGRCKIARPEQLASLRADSLIAVGNRSLNEVHL